MGQILRAGKCFCISFIAADVQLPSRAKPTYFVMAEHLAFAWKKKLSPMGGGDVKQKVFLRLKIFLLMKIVCHSSSLLPHTFSVLPLL